MEGVAFCAGGGLVRTLWSIATGVGVNVLCSAYKKNNPGFGSRSGISLSISGGSKGKNDMIETMRGVFKPARAILVYFFAALSENGLSLASGSWRSQCSFAVFW